jgi:hypothetical protein
LTIEETQHLHQKKIFGKDEMDSDEFESGDELRKSILQPKGKSLFEM